MVWYVFSGPFSLPVAEIPITTLITFQDCLERRNKIQSLEINQKWHLHKNILLLGKLDLPDLWFGDTFTPKTKKSLKILHHQQKHSENDTERSVVRSTSKMSHLPVAFIAWKSRHHQTCGFWDIYWSKN